jgi:hypothetical protein
MAKAAAKLKVKKLIQRFVSHLAAESNIGLQVDRWPDEETRDSQDIDAEADHFAIEHTSIDTIANQRRDFAWFNRAVGSLQAELLWKHPFRLRITLPYEVIQLGQQWSKIRAALKSWILNQSPKLSQGCHIIKNVPDIPFEFRVSKWPSQRPKVIFARHTPPEKSFLKHIKEQLDRKLQKLVPYRNKGKTTILLVESDDMGLMNEGLMVEGIKSSYPDSLPRGVDQIWFADTSIPEEILFTDLTEAICQ